jgi:phytoene synthase
MRGEPDRYIAATLAPASARPALITLAAFAAELGRIPATVSEPALGDIRLQWWRDGLLAGRDGDLTGHPVCDAMIDAMRRHDLPEPLVAGLIDAREFDLSGGLPEHDEGLFAYLDATEGHLFRMAMQVLGTAGDDAAAIADLAGRAYGIARALGRLPMLLHNGGVVLPASRLHGAGLDPARLTEAPISAAAEAAVARVAGDLGDLARAALRVARDRARALPKGARVALLPLAMVEPYFRAQSGCRLLVEMTEDVSPLARTGRLGWAHLTGRI